MSKSISSAKKQKLIFYISMAALPILQFIVFYVYVNIRSFTMAFQGFNRDTGKFYFAGFENFVKLFSDFKTNPDMSFSLVNSLELFLWTFVFGSVLAIFFSYYIYKKHFLSGFFKIILYTPHIISSVVFVILYKYFVDVGVKEIAELFGKEMRLGLLSDKSNMGTVKTTVMFFSIWIGFGTQVLLYSGAMSGINQSVIESGKLDGITPMKELWYIVIPLVWSTFETFMVVSVMGLFTNQMSLFTFFDANAEPQLYTFGYYLYMKVYSATTAVDYPYLSAMGLLLTAVAVPLTLFTKWALGKFGPKTQ